ncbi:transporter suffix domain-containing protein [Candidimonas sp. SYP-B2681]|uniref:transporter suffix domain-containing protein n=1 Tax=Candidimonas sp. SYP-B2681 TaxID=2497686 RepID=UPI000F86037F|nr:transporter suffix domain-containing protein [Candidimonas sp. SYP-B2681]RTZ47472.1 transporter suffix domain-containing protein [Candidimonas sp. SYP-B2681]
MSSSDNQAEAVPAKGWRFKCGIGLFIFALALWALIPFGAAMGVPGSRIAALTATVFIANKILLIACIAIMGKEGFQQLKAIVFGHAKRLAPAKKVGPVRHAIGLVMFIVPILTALLEPYVDKTLPGFRPNLWQLQALGDIMLIASFFVLGGDFWSKLRALFIRTV